MDRRLQFPHDPVQQGCFSCSWLTDEGNKALAFTDAIEQACIRFFMPGTGIKKSRVRSEVERLLTQAKIGGIHVFPLFRGLRSVHHEEAFSRALHLLQQRGLYK